MANSTARPTVDVRVSAAVFIGKDLIVNPTTTFTVSGNPYQVTENLITSVTADITRGWAGKKLDEWGARSLPYAEQPGKGAIEMLVSIGTGDDAEYEGFRIAFETNESVARAIVNAAHALADEAQAWAMGLKRKAAGYDK